MINVEQARAGLVAAIAQKGEDYVYPEFDEKPCTYSINGEPSCIVGYAVDSIGHDLFLLLQTEEAKDGPMSVYSIESLDFTYAAKNALQRAQGAQDAGQTWGESLRIFDEVITTMTAEDDQIE